VRAGLRSRISAAGLAISAAFLWATYYLFVLGTSPAARPSAILFYPFLGGGLGYVAFELLRGEARPLLGTFARSGAYLRVGLLLGMQVSVLAATFLTGAVDASLLSLLGDVVATPLVVAALVRVHRRELTSPRFLAGLALCSGGGALAIVGGGGVSAVRGPAWLVVAGVPLTVAFFFVLSARAGARGSVSATVGGSMLGAALGAALLAPLVPGGDAGLLAIPPAALGLLLVNGLASFFLAPLLYFRSIERAGLAFPPMLMTGIPVFTLLLSSAVLGLSPPVLALLGVPIAAAGGLVALAAGGDATPSEGPVTASP
jgi:drug/metabolite transporter (DMT)-like permease